MAFVLADQQGWLRGRGKLPFEPVVCGDLAALRRAVTDGSADFFMWEHFTTKRHYDAGELKKIGEIPTPWNGWHIAAAGDETDGRLDEFVTPALAKAIEHFQENKQEAVDYISSNMAYSVEDASAWYDEVVYPKELGKVDMDGIKGAIASLQKAGVIEHNDAVPWKTVLGGASRAWGEDARAPK
ncbi:hypothetical protein FH972_024637 [Carpinus fangiana]|uniref:Ca3427-like PBP 2 domain-containing protein n=1 Tax=Carpinus fangiana TaxID=176857 RepID=A0A5N6L143_9ROSI|nr:hypothetical protein FH972_024637 [Carpinus fangiana]